MYVHLGASSWRVIFVKDKECRSQNNTYVNFMTLILAVHKATLNLHAKLCQFIKKQNKARPRLIFAKFCYHGVLFLITKFHEKYLFFIMLCIYLGWQDNVTHDARFCVHFIYHQRYNYMLVYFHTHVYNHIVYGGDEIFIDMLAYDGLMWNLWPAWDCYWLILNKVFILNFGVRFVLFLLQ